MNSLTESLPLRTTAEYKKRKEVAVIPIIYGTATIKPLSIDNNGRLWLVSSHAISRIVSAKTTSGERVNTYLNNTTDEKGLPVAICETEKPLEDGSLILNVNGKMGKNGQLITNPASVIQDINRVFYGKELGNSALSYFSSDCTKNGLLINGVIDDSYPSGRALLADICNNASAIFSTSFDEYARLFPPEKRPDEAITNYYNSVFLETLGASTSSANIANELTVNFDFDHSANSYRQSVLLESVQSISKYGRRKATFDLKLTNNLRQALFIGKRWLAYKCNPIIDIQATIKEHNTIIKPGTWVSMNALQTLGARQLFIMGANNDINTGVNKIVSEYSVDGPSDITIVSTSSAVDYDSPITLYTYNEDTATITVLGADNQPIERASVTLDDTTKITDVNGIVRFRTEPGTHYLEIEAEGYLSVLLPEYLIEA